MPRPKKPDQDGKEVKKRSRNGCWPCKGRKVKCGEEKPECINCQRQGETCDYSIRLNWDGRSKKKEEGKPGSQPISFDNAFGQVDIPGSSSHGSPNGSQSWHLSPRTSYQGQPSPAPVSLYPAIPPQEQQLPPISNYPNATPLPSGDFDTSNTGMPSHLRAHSWQDSEGTSTFPGMTPIASLRQAHSMSPYPSPSESAFGSPRNIPGIMNPNGPSWQMPPPTSNPTSQDVARSPYNGAKRMRLSPRAETFARSQNLLRRESSFGPLDIDDLRKVAFTSPAPNHLQPGNPLTPGGSSTTSDDKWMARSNPYISPDSDGRRISVSSLLSNSPEPEDRLKVQVQPPLEDLYAYEPPPASRRGSLHHTMISYSETETYGLDRGYPDLDIPKNNDTIATNGVSPSEHSDFDSWLSEFEQDNNGEFGFRLEKRETLFAKGGYYATPVPIKIPRKLEPLPKTLQENPMNLLYFHHFLNHTARVLVPHDCPENPFKTVLPAMAVENPNLLNLLLAYSASHRARLLSHPEPANRIALWVRDVFPDLRHSLDNLSSAKVSNANLATAIMLASLEIISPSSFGVSIPWQNHLSIARSIIRSRGGPHSISRSDSVLYFLTRWLAYLDVLGSLSGRMNEEPLFAGNYWANSTDSDIASARSLSFSESDIDDDDYTIDCLLGFTTRCVSILAQVASLARQCDGQRIDPVTSQVRPEWRPSKEILEQAERLKLDLEQARDHEQKACAHHSPVLSKAGLHNSNGSLSHSHSHTHYHTHHNGTSSSNLMTQQEADESVATNSAFHWAGLVHLLRRVHNLPRSDLQVQNAVHELVKIVEAIREGGSAEACLLFPMFTAGVEAESEEDRVKILRRVKGAEGIGMFQITRARKIMEEVWRTGVSWESLFTGEFFG